jgi:DNA-binding transcriptional ArsR family regulator
MADERLARALRSRIRRGILKELASSDRTSVHAFAKKNGLSESCASKHFSLLFDLGLLDYEERPPEKFYSLRIPQIRKLLAVYDEVVSRMN